MLTLLRITVISFLITTLSLVSLNGQVNDSTTFWETKAMVGLNFSTVQLENWSGGGEETITINGLFNIIANYKDESQFWQNSLDLGYGETQQGKLNFRKSDDRINFVSKYGKNFSEEFSLSALIDFRTQLADGFDYSKLDDQGNPILISSLLSPGYAIVGVGVSYQPESYITITISPVSNRVIIVLDDSLSAKGAYGVDPGENVLSELGSQMSVNFKKDIFENVNLQSRLNSFAPYEKFDTWVVNWESLITMKINSWLNASIAYDVFYDDKIKLTRADNTIGPATQSRLVFSLGLAYKFDY